MMEHSIHTSFGDSTATFGGKEWRLKAYVSLQRNGASTMIWEAINTVLFPELTEKNYGGVFRAPVTNLLTQLAEFVFDDDIDLLQTQRHDNEVINEVIQQLQGSLDTWQDPLNTSGGSLDCDNPNKSYWYIIVYEWSSNGR